MPIDDTSANPVFCSGSHFMFVEDVCPPAPTFSTKKQVKMFYLDVSFF